ncbi:hypothetical protein KCP78_09340 [Salmonella enterica subsp. enterica]|nr:hypothetical protein KCP78_09340 [Salmonella enterica subsp. enterica]
MVRRRRVSDRELITLVLATALLQQAQIVIGAGLSIPNCWSRPRNAMTAPEPYPGADYRADGGGRESGKTVVRLQNRRCLAARPA